MTVCSHPKWTPVIVMTQNAELFSFANHFRDWLWTDLTSSNKADKLSLPVLRVPSNIYPVTGERKVRMLVVHKAPQLLGSEGLVCWAIFDYITA